MGAVDGRAALQSDAAELLCARGRGRGGVCFGGGEGGANGEGEGEGEQCRFDFGWMKARRVREVVRSGSSFVLPPTSKPRLV